MTTVVVGGGLAGLAAANALADRGERVTLLESRNRLGGRATTDERGGHLFNQGPHALYRAGAGLRVLRQLGIDPPGGIPAVKGTLGVHEDRVARLPAGPWSLLRTPLVRGRDKIELAALLRGIDGVATGSLAGMSTTDWLEASLSTPRLRMLVAGMIRVATYSADLDFLSADVGVSQLQLALHNVRYVHGGWQTIVEALAARARTARVEIRTGAAVTSIVPGPSGCREVVLSDESLAAEHVVVAASPKVAARLSGSEALLAWSREVEPVTAATLDVGLQMLPAPRRRFAYGVDRPLYFSVHSPPARLGSGTTLHVMKYLSRNDQAQAAHVRAELEDFLELLQPGWRDVLVRARFMRRMVVSNALPAVRNGGGRGRPGVVVADRPGIYVAGDWVGPTGHLADAAIASGKLAADAVIGARLVRS